MIPGAPGDVWGTILNDPYENESGSSLIAPAFTVDGTTGLMEIFHYYDIETPYDGGNVTVNGEVILPVGGYPSEALSTSDSYYAW